MFTTFTLAEIKNKKVKTISKHKYKTIEQCSLEILHKAQNAKVGE